MKLDILGLNHNFKGSYLHNNKDVHNPEIGKVDIASVMEYPAINLAPQVEQGDYYDTIPGPMIFGP